MTTISEIQWCPQCQSSTSVKEVVRDNKEKGERTISRYCYKCGLSLSTGTMPISDEPIEGLIAKIK